MHRGPLFWGIVLTTLFAALYRLFPLVSGPEVLSQFFITEDGYLMLTVARNLAIGNGLSVSDGEIATNGVQPLATLLYALPYAVTGGDKLASLTAIVASMAVISGLAIWTIHGFARGVLRPQSGDPAWPWLVAALWFAGPLLLLHSMNALETGLYTFVVSGTVWYFGTLTARGGAYTLRDQIVLGTLCGLTFLARNDAVFLVTALFLVRFVHVQASGQLGLVAAVREALLPGAISLLWAAPWLIHNQLFFGSIVPISGSAQSMSAGFAQNLPMIPVKLFEHMFPMLPVPRGVEDAILLRVLSTVTVLAVMGACLWQAFRHRNPFRVALAAYALYGVFLVAYYGLHFGAAHFLSRYLAPLAPLLITSAISVGLFVAARLPDGGRRTTRWAGTGALILCVILLMRNVVPSMKDQGHFQVVDWVRGNVTEEVWVGAVQTGTLGYWHDRTINLDGKVNPEALRARREEGDVLDYIVDSEIDYLADWHPITRWVNRGNARFSEAFEVVVDDPVRDLGVLRRIVRPN